MRLAVSQVIERSPGRGVSVRGHRALPEPPHVGPAVTSITKTPPWADGGRNDRAAGADGQGPAGPRQHGGHRVPAGQQLHGGVPVRLVHAACSGDVGARRSGVHEAGAGDRYPRPWGDPVVAAADVGTFRKTMARSLRISKEQLEATAPPTT